MSTRIPENSSTDPGETPTWNDPNLHEINNLDTKEGENSSPLYRKDLRNSPSGKIPSCHPEKKYRAKGLCVTCYERALRAKRPEYHRRMRWRWLKANPHKAKLSRIRRIYKISAAEYQAFLDRANNSCEICSSKKNLRIDHDHKTNKVRGLLCQRCNVLVGHIEHSKDRLGLDWLQQVEKYIGR